MAIARQLPTHEGFRLRRRQPACDDESCLKRSPLARLPPYRPISPWNRPVLMGVCPVDCSVLNARRTIAAVALLPPTLQRAQSSKTSPGCDLEASLSQLPTAS